MSHVLSLLSIFLRRLGSQPTAEPVPVSTDEIVQMHRFDDTKVNDMVMSYSMYFNDILDPAIVQSSLSRLLEIGEWRKLGGRLRRNVAGRLEIHIPQEFTADRPAISYSHESFNISIRDHPIASRLPSGTSVPTLFSGFDDAIRSMAYMKNVSTNLDYYLRSDRPQVSLHIVSFTDATLVTFFFPHTMADGTSLAVMIKSWSAVMAGHEEKVPLTIGTDADPMIAIASSPRKDPFIHADKQWKTVHFLSLMVRSLWSRLWGPKREARTFCVPQQYVSVMKQTALRYLSESYQPDDSAGGRSRKEPYLSDGDVIVAWLTRIACGTLRPSSTLPVTIVNVFDIRDRIPYAFKPKKAEVNRSVYIGNAILAAYAYLPANTVLSQPLAQTAAQTRAAIVEQTSVSQVEARVRLERETLESTGGKPSYYIPMNSYPVFFTNLCRTQLFEAADFSPAVQTSDSASSRTMGLSVGFPAYYHPQRTNAAATPPFDVFAILGKDKYGHYWIRGTLTDIAWEKINQEIARM